MPSTDTRRTEASGDGTVPARDTGNEGRSVAMPWIRVIPAEGAEGDLKLAYERAEVGQGPMWPPFDVMTNNGPALLRLMELSDVIRFGPAAISRLQREMIATYVSALNDCFF
jgi:alkylhydroperoxidase family enzyme